MLLQRLVSWLIFVGPPPLPPKRIYLGGEAIYYSDVLVFENVLILDGWVKWWMNNCLRENYYFNLQSSQSAEHSTSHLL